MKVYPHTSSAISLTKLIFFHCSSSVKILPSSVEANPHWVLKHNLSNGTYCDASLIRAIIVDLSSGVGYLDVIRPRTTSFSSDTSFNGLKSPERSSSNSR